MFNYILQIFLEDRFWYERPCKDYQEIKDTIKELVKKQKKGQISTERRLGFRVFEVSTKASGYAFDVYNKESR